MVTQEGSRNCGSLATHFTEFRVLGAAALNSARRAPINAWRARRTFHGPWEVAMRRIVTVVLLASAGCLCASPGFANVCQSPSPPTAFPEPATANERDILAAQ